MTAQRLLDTSNSKPIAKEAPEKLHIMLPVVKKAPASDVRPANASLYRSIMKIEEAILSETVVMRYLTPIRVGKRAATRLKETPSTVFSRVSGYLLRTEPLSTGLAETLESPLTKRDPTSSPRKESASTGRYKSTPLSKGRMGRRLLVNLRYGCSS
jgi:hypothetical protein